VYIGIDGMRIRVDRSKNSISDIDALSSLGFIFQRQNIQAITRRIKSSFSLEYSQDIQSMRGVDLMSSMINSLQHEMQQTIDQQIIDDLIKMADAIHITHYDRVIHYV
jgi:hypothetical protein